MDYQYIQCHGWISKPWWGNTARDKNRIYVVSFIKSIRNPRWVFLWQKTSHWLPASGGGRKLERTAANLGANSNILSLGCCHVGVDVCQKLTLCSSDVWVYVMWIIFPVSCFVRVLAPPWFSCSALLFGWCDGVLVAPVLLQTQQCNVTYRQTPGPANLCIWSFDCSPVWLLKVASSAACPSLSSCSSVHCLYAWSHRTQKRVVSSGTGI